MNADLLTEDLKKTRASNGSSRLIGQPDVRPTSESGADGIRHHKVEVLGFDYHHTRSGGMVPGIHATSPCGCATQHPTAGASSRARCLFRWPALPGLTIVDNVSRVSPAIEVNSSLTGVRVVRMLSSGREVRGPQVMSVDNGPESISKNAADEWAYRRGVQIEFSRPGTPTERLRFEIGCVSVTSGPIGIDARDSREPARSGCASRRPRR